MRSYPSDMIGDMLIKYPSIAWWRDYYFSPEALLQGVLSVETTLFLSIVLFTSDTNAFR